MLFNFNVLRHQPPVKMAVKKNFDTTCDVKSKTKHGFGRKFGQIFLKLKYVVTEDHFVFPIENRLHTIFEL